MKILAAALLLSPTMTLAETSQEYCQNFIIETGRYLPGFANVVLEGPSLTVGEGENTWTVAHDTLTLRFENRDIVFTVKNTHPSALADYIGTTMLYRQKGHEPFGVITDDTDRNRIALIQPDSSEDGNERYCHGFRLRE